MTSSSAGRFLDLSLPGSAASISGALARSEAK
jgi:hypothetical protein